MAPDSSSESLSSKNNDFMQYTYIEANKRITNSLNLGAIEEKSRKTINDIILNHNKNTKVHPSIIRLFSKGNEHYQRREFELSILFYDMVLEKEPYNTMALNNRGMALQSLGRYKEAIEYDDKALEAEPENVSAISNKGSSLSSLGSTKRPLSMMTRRWRQSQKILR